MSQDNWSHGCYVIAFDLIGIHIDGGALMVGVFINIHYSRVSLLNSQLAHTRHNLNRFCFMTMLLW